ncbi:MAG: hypothetical protein JJU36_07655 [Phycisphaeraceae bacterium]|nr:hypothetical protein [Phycisphaeraceae bacterium]
MDTIHQLESEIRKYINQPRIQYRIMQSNRDWTQLCVSLDVIGDSQSAIEAYAAAEAESGSGMAYLQVFGLFQAFFLQQDATKHLAEALNITLTNFDELSEVRKTRNDIVGHPTKRGTSEKTTWHVISRPTLCKERFSVLSTGDASPKLVSRTIDVERHMKLQVYGVKGQLRRILDELGAQKREHAMRFADEKLADIFAQGMLYHCTKIFEGIGRPSHIPVAEISLDTLHGWVEAFCSALTDRSELPGNQSIQSCLDELCHTFLRLRGFFNGESPLNADDARIFAYFLDVKMRELAKIAAELDQDYAAHSSDLPADEL